MHDPNEIEALKASFRGALKTADALAAMSQRVEAMDPSRPLDDEDLSGLTRLAAAHAVASAALRGLVETIAARRAGNPR